MLIDWFTVGAQLVNFLILVWLMKRFLYKPILYAIDERERRIAETLADADAQKTEARKERDEFRNKNETFDRQRAELLSKAEQEARSERERLLEEARKAADELSAGRRDALERQQRGLNDRIIRRTREEVFAITRKTLKYLAGADMEERMGEVFSCRLRELDDEKKQDIARALKTSSEPVLVRSAFELSSEQQAAIQRALNETFSVETQVRFETAPDVISGIELTTNGRKVAWSIAEYLAALEKKVDEILQEKGRPAVGTMPEAEEPQPGTTSG